MYQVQKRDGKIVEFDITKISGAIRMAFDAQQRQYNDSLIDFLALKVTADFEPLIKDGLIAVEDIQDCVESVLIKAGYDDVAKAYILYRRQREKLRNINSTMLDYKSIVDNYLNVSDWRVKENSTVTYSVGGLILSNSGAITANYWLSEIYDDEIANAHKNADIHLHDLSMLTGYCAGWSLKQLIQEGLGGVPGKISSSPASHLSTLCNQMVNFLGIMQNEWAGAQAFSSFDTYLAPFVRADNLTYKEVKQCVQSFVYGVNTPSRWGTQSPFTNITLDWTCPADLKDLKAIVGGKELDFTYGDCQKEMDMVNKAFIEIMIEGDCNGRGFQYPIPTYSITKDFDWSETENNKLLFEMTAKYGTPYFSNYINSDMEPSDVRSMCCRLRLDLRELRKKSGGFFGSGESTGSIGVVTINLPRIAYLSATPEEFYKRLDHMMDIAARSLDVKRKVISKLLDEGLYPYTKRYLGGFDNHFSTIGLVGMNEAGLNAKWLRADMTHKETQQFAIDVLNHMRERLSDYQEQYGDLFNLEATPAESTAFRLAKHDVKRFGDIITAADCGGTPYYTNSSHLPVGYTEDVFAALDVQDELQTLYTSGTVFHAFLGEKLPDWKAAATLVRTIAENYKLPYYTMSPTYSICKNHGYLAGEVSVCPECGEPTEVYSRITGYYRPVQNWNEGKVQEYKQRKTYDIGTSFSIHRDKHIEEPLKAIEPKATDEGIAISPEALATAGIATAPKIDIPADPFAATIAPAPETIELKEEIGTVAESFAAPAEEAVKPAEEAVTTAAENAEAAAADVAEKVEEAVETAAENAGEAVENVTEKVEDVAEEIAEKAEEATEAAAAAEPEKKPSHIAAAVAAIAAALSLKPKAKADEAAQLAEKAEDAAQEVAANAEAAVADTLEKTEEAAAEAVDNIEAAAESVAAAEETAEKVEEAVETAAETAEKAAEKVAEEAAEEAAEKVAEGIEEQAVEELAEAVHEAAEVPAEEAAATTAEAVQAAAETAPAAHAVRTPVERLADKAAALAALYEAADNKAEDLAKDYEVAKDLKEIKAEVAEAAEQTESKVEDFMINASEAVAEALDFEEKPQSEAPAEEPVAEPEAPAEEPAAEPEAPAEEPAAEPEAPAEEPAAEPEVPAEEPVAEPEAPAEEPVAEPEAPAEEPAAEPEAPAEEPAAEPEASAEEPAAEPEAPAAAPAEPEKPAAPQKRFLLFTTRTCPNCATIKAFLAEQGTEYELILAEEHRELARNLGIMQAPTAVIVEGNRATKYVGVSKIKNYVLSQQQ